MNPTVRDMLFGVFIYSVIIEIAGLILSEAPFAYTMGIFLGTAVTVFLIFHMYHTLDKAMEMDADGAQKYIMSQSFLRLFVRLLAAFLGLKLEAVSFLAVIISLLGVKYASLLQPFVNKYITQKIFREGE